MRARTALAAAFGAALVMSRPAVADDVLACVDRDIAAALLKSPSAGSPVISDDWSPQVPNVDLPPDFELIGSSTRSVTGVVALESSLAPDEARQRIDAVLTAAGWRGVGGGSAIGSSGPPLRQPGFHVPRLIEISRPSRYCRGDAGPMAVNVTAATRQKGSYVTLVTYRNSRPTCADLAGNGRRQTARSQMPSLALPDGVTMLGSYGQSSSGDLLKETTNSQIRADLTSATLLEHLGLQLATQQWRRTSEWDTTGFSGSSWRAANSPSVGHLTIVANGGGQYDLRFQVISLEE